MSPTIIYIRGWRLFFYSNEQDEPMHIHAKKGETECKYWIYPDIFEIEEVFSFNLTPALKREVRQIIFNNFNEIVEAWSKKWRQ